MKEGSAQSTGPDKKNYACNSFSNALPHYIMLSNPYLSWIDSTIQCI